MTKTMIKSMSATAGAMLAAMMVLPTAASANSADAAYCTALVQTYERHIDLSSRSRMPQGVEARHGVELCKQGNTAGIPAIERALDAARIPLPSRG
ncbi:MAG: hypothetical protein U1E60_17780 [Reyranellaceae bacterium]